MRSVRSHAAAGLLLSLTATSCHWLIPHGPAAQDGRRDQVGALDLPRDRARELARDLARQDGADLARDLPAKPDLKPKPDLKLDLDGKLKPDLRPPDAAIVAPLFVDTFSNGTWQPSWSLFRMKFAVVNGRLEAQDAAEPGFLYGSGGNGRGAIALVGIGMSSWTSYRFGLDIEALESASFAGTRGIPSCYRGFALLFRVQAFNKSWNAPSTTCYFLGIDTRTCTGISVQGKWELHRHHDFWMTGTGYDIAKLQGGAVKLRAGNSPYIIDGQNRMEVSVKGNQISILANGKVVDAFTDAAITPDSGVTYGPLGYGGVGVQFGWDTRGWIDNVTVDPL